MSGAPSDAVADVVIERVRDAAGQDAFLRVPYKIYADDPTWVPPLIVMEKRRLSPKHNPFFEYGEAQLFVAMRNGEPIGRITAHINRRHQELYRDGAGHFGFYECVDDQTVANALVSAAADWLRRRGCQKMIGPMNFSHNDEIGLLVEGFDSPPAVFMTQSRPWMGPQIERAGMHKAMDLFAYRMRPEAADDKLYRMAKHAKDTGRVTFRKADMKHYHREVALLVDIFNDAWSENWGFTPTSAREMDLVIGEMRWFFSGDLARFILLDGEPVGVGVVLPNYNEIVQPFGGKLLPLNWATMFWKLWRNDMTSARFTLLGMRKSARGGVLGAAMLALLCEVCFEVAKKYKLEWVEFSWILETNRAMRGFAEVAAGPPAKRYRMYEMAL